MNLVWYAGLYLRQVAYDKANVLHHIELFTNVTGHTLQSLKHPRVLPLATITVMRWNHQRLHMLKT